MDVFDFAEKIQTKQDFLTFIQKIIVDFHENKEEWENVNLDDFLEAMYRYCNDKEFDEPSWKVFADILLGASIYE